MNLEPVGTDEKTGQAVYKGEDGRHYVKNEQKENPPYAHRFSVRTGAQVSKEDAIKEMDRLEADVKELGLKRVTRNLSHLGLTDQWFGEVSGRTNEDGFMEKWMQKHPMKNPASDYWVAAGEEARHDMRMEGLGEMAAEAVAEKYGLPYDATLTEEQRKEWRAVYDALVGGKRVLGGAFYPKEVREAIIKVLEAAVKDAEPEDVALLINGLISDVRNVAPISKGDFKFIGDMMVRYGEAITDDKTRGVVRSLLPDWTDWSEGRENPPMTVVNPCENPADGMPPFDDTYTGPRWRYGMESRPFSTFSAPAGVIIQSGKKHPDYPMFGTVDYTRRLTDEEASHFGFVLVEETVESNPRGRASPTPYIRVRTLVEIPAENEMMKPLPAGQEYDADIGTDYGGKHVVSLWTSPYPTGEYQTTPDKLELIRVYKELWEGHHGKFGKVSLATGNPPSGSGWRPLVPSERVTTIVKPENTTEKRLPDDQDFAIWEFSLTDTSKYGSSLFKAVVPTANPPRFIPPELDVMEQRWYDDFTSRGQSPEEALRVIFNTVEGDWSQLSEGLRKYAEQKGWIAEWDSATPNPKMKVRLGGNWEKHFGMVLVEAVDYHRNGVSGNGFHVVAFTVPKGIGKANRKMVGVVFEEKGNVAVFDRELLGKGHVLMHTESKGGVHDNAWRGDEFEEMLRMAVHEYNLWLKAKNAGNDELARLLEGKPNPPADAWTQKFKDLTDARNAAGSHYFRFLLTPCVVEAYEAWLKEQGKESDFKNADKFLWWYRKETDRRNPPPKAKEEKSDV